MQVTVGHDYHKCKWVGVLRLVGMKHSTYYHRVVMLVVVFEFVTYTYHIYFIDETTTEEDIHPPPQYNTDDPNHVVPFTHLQWRAGPHIVTATAKEDWIAQLNIHDGSWWEVRNDRGRLMCVVQSGACTW